MADAAIEEARALIAKDELIVHLRGERDDWRRKYERTMESWNVETGRLVTERDEALEGAQAMARDGRRILARVTALESALGNVCRAVWDRQRFGGAPIDPNDPYADEVGLRLAEARAFLASKDADTTHRGDPCEGAPEPGEVMCTGCRNAVPRGKGNFTCPECGFSGFTTWSCKSCGSVQVGQTGEYPCPECGLPKVWDEVSDTETESGEGASNG